MADNRFLSYLAALKTNFVKLAKIEFLNPDGSVAYALDNDPKNKRSGAFLQDGEISCNLTNGRRRQASVTLSNVSGDYDFSVDKIWFGQQIRLSEGLLLPDGTEYYIPQGIFEIEQPNEHLSPRGNTVTFRLVDKWANLDGTLGGNLEGAYSIQAGTDIFQAMASLLRLGKYDMANNSKNPIDPIPPLFTSYYNGKTQTLTDGTEVPLTEAPYDFLSDEQGCLADVLLGLSEMLAAWIGYNQVGRLVVDPSQDDILDATKPVLWDFSMNEKQLLNVEYTTNKDQIFNDIIVVGDTSDTSYTARGRAQNRDPASDTCISRIGLKTQRIHMANYYADEICESMAAFKLKRAAVASKTVNIECTQMFHIVENGIVTVQRLDKPGAPVERHVVQGFTRPLGQTGTMIINAISVQDFPTATIIKDSGSGASAIAGIAIAGQAVVGTQ
jgi:hypothetical protein